MTIKSLSTKYYYQDDADAYGTDASIILYNIRHWICTYFESKDSHHNRDGNYWVYYTYENLAELYPQYSKHQIKRIISKLESEGAIVSHKYYADKWDHKKWYRLSDEKEYLELKYPKRPKRRNRPIDETEESDRRDEIVPSTTNYKQSNYKLTDREKEEKPESEVDKIISKWNSEESLPSFESNSNTDMKIGKKLIELERDEVYPLDVINAISNFSDLKRSPDTWFKGQYNLASFLGVNGRKEQLSKFLVGNYCKEEYLNEQEGSTLSNEQKEVFKKMKEDKKKNAEQAAIDIAELTALIEGGDYE